MPNRSLASALAGLRARNIDFIVVGGVAAVLQGAPVQTFDQATRFAPANTVRQVTNSLTAL